MKTLTGTRLYAIDNLRIVLTALVVAHHAAITYGNIPLWYYTEPAQDATGGALDLLVVADQAFFMGFFFLISGFFTPGSHDRKGARVFVRDRLLRLGVPLLAYLLLLRPLADIGGVLGRGDTPFWQYYLRSWDPGPMWFVEVLIVLALAYAGWRALRAPLDRRPAPLTVRPVVLFTLGLAAATFLWRLIVPSGTYWPVIGLPTPYFLPQYVSLFVLGCLAYRRGWFETLPARAAGLGFTLAGVATPLLLVPSLLTTGALSTALMAAWESAFAVGMIIGLTVWFRERHHTQGPRGRFLAGHAFTVYIIHPLVLVGLGWALSPLDTLAVVKFAAMLVLALPLCWWLAYLVRSLPGAKRVL
ncbi:acyltransferase family protein [[Actinomadura] parvosata]|uniref:acyltransferase family protein n=1 Tax=[Actinomadura] parvosata TaxID=1955412 RepID=UPI00406C0A28